LDAVEVAVSSSSNTHTSLSTMHSLSASMTLASRDSDLAGAVDRDRQITVRS
jgi:hypothetical protein